MAAGVAFQLEAVALQNVRGPATLENLPGFAADGPVCMMGFS